VLEGIGDPQEKWGFGFADVRECLAPTGLGLFEKLLFAEVHGTPSINDEALLGEVGSWSE
jgi:hypothetical protein